MSDDPTKEEQFHLFFDTNFSKTPHCLVRIIDRKLSLAAQACIRVILDKTVSWWKVNARISIEDFREYTGIKADNTIRKAIQELQDKKLIHVKDHGRYTSKTYEINIRTFALVRQTESFDIPSP